MIEKGQLDLGKGYATIDMTALSSGLYVLHLSDGTHQENKKIIKS